MTNRKFSLLFFLCLSFGLLAMDAPEKKKGILVFEDALVDAVRDNNFDEASRLLCGDAGSDYIQQEGKKAFLLAVKKKNKKIMHLLLAHGDEKKLLAAKTKKYTVLELAQKKKNPEILQLITTLMKKQTKSDFPQVFFSPGIQDYLKNLIANEKKSIKIAMYWFFDNYLAKQIEDRLMKNVKIKLIYDQGCFSNIPQFLCDKGALVKKWTQDKGLMHHKFWIFGKNIDDKQLVAVGSYNATGAAEKTNCENIVILDDKEVIKKFLKQFEYLWKTPTEKLKKRKRFLKPVKN